MRQSPRLISTRWPPYLVLSISIAATLVCAYYLATTARNKDQARFETAVHQTTNAIRERMQIYEGALRGGAALFALDEVLGRDEFGAYADRLRLRELYRGIQGFGFTKRVMHEDKEAFVEEMSATFGPGFEISPPGERSEYFPVTYLEPEDERNLAAIGFDMFSESVRQRAISTARDTGYRAFSGKVTLVQEIDDDIQAGFLVYLPIYQGGVIPPTVEERREKLIGCAYAPFRADDLFGGIFGSGSQPLIHLRVYDGTEVHPDSLLHTSAIAASGTPQFSTTTTFDLPGNSWVLLLESTPAFEERSSRFLALWVFVVGGFISFTLFGITRALNDARTGAEVSRQRAAEQREEYQVTLSSIGDGVIATDLQGNVTFMNPVAEELTNWPLTKAQGQPLPKVFRTENELTGERLPIPTQRVLTENRAISVTQNALLLGRNGTARPIEHSAAPIRDYRGSLRGVVLVFHDVSLRRASDLRRERAEEKLRDAQSRLESAIQAASVGTWIWEIEENRVFADAYLAQVFGVTPQQTEGGPVEDYLKAIHPDDVPLLKARIDSSLNSAEMQEIEYRIPKENGEIRWFTARGRIERDQFGKSPRFIGAIIDVTERKETEDALAQTKAELERYAKNLEATVAERTARLRGTVDELEAFSYSLSHDLRAPLRAIQGFSQILLDEFGKHIGSDGAGYVNKVVSAAARMDRLIHDVLAFSRVSRQEISVESIDTDKLIRSIVHELPELQEPRAEIIIEGPLLSIRGHEASLTQCITNLLENAVKFVAPDVKPRVRIRNEINNSDVRIWFEDNGIGIDEEARHKLFEMFQRVHGGSYSGTGLGLAIVRKAAERMGGQAGVESQHGQGSRFWLQLPKGE